MGRALADAMPIVRGRSAPSGVYEERELTEPVDLCDAHGRLDPDAVGWSRRPLVRANLSGHPLRKKRWNFWNWIEPGFVLSATLAELDYASLFGAFFIDLEQGEAWRAGSIGLPGRFDLPEHVERTIAWRSGSVDYENAVDGDVRRVRLRTPTTDGAELDATLVVEIPPGQESLNVVVPWSERRFQLNSKHNTLPTSGRICVGERTWQLDPDRCHAVQDWGRGVWPRHAFWNWGVCSGVQDGRRIGVNVGARWTDRTGSNENGIFLDGRLHKVMEDLRWDYDPADDDGNWRVHSVHSDTIDMTLSTRFPHRSRTNLGIVRTGGVCAFGTWSGRIRVEGETIGIRDLPGWAEEFEHYW